MLANKEDESSSKGQVAVPWTTKLKQHLQKVKSTVISKPHPFIDDPEYGPYSRIMKVNVPEAAGSED